MYKTIGVEFKVSDNLMQYVTAAGAGDVEAMAKLYSKTLKSSYFLANELCADSDAAVDVTKKAYARAFSNLSKLKKPDAFELWMKQNVALVYKESKKFVFDDADAAASESSTEFLAESVLENEETCAAVADAVTALRPELRTAVLLHYNNGMPVANLAKILGVSESTANALLSKARSNILLWSGAAASSESTGSIPVLTKIFQSKESAAKVPETAVREIFGYAFAEYKKSLIKETFAAAAAEAETKPEEENQAPAEETVTFAPAAPAAEVPKEETELSESPAEEEKSAEPEQAAETSDPVISFKQKISEILSQEPAIPETEEKSEGADEDDSGIDMPGFSIPASETQNAVDSFSADMESEEKHLIKDENNYKRKSGKKPGKKIKIDPKVLIAAAAIVLIIAAIFGIKAIAGKKQNSPSSSKSQSETVETYKWVAGGFDECTDIIYLNENVCYFKSKTTGKFGLMDYSGNIILEPKFDSFSRCGKGRDYSGRGGYHILAELGGLNYEVTVNGSNVSIAETPHTAHSLEVEKLDSKKYVERDRYFEGYAAAQNDKGKWGYVDSEKDKKVIPFEYEAINEFDNMQACDYCRPVTGGLIAVKKNGKMGIINLENEIVAPFEYSNIMPGSNGIFIAEKNSVWGVILTGEAMNTFTGINLSVKALPDVPSDLPEEPIGKYIIANENGANVRADAGSEFDLVEELPKGKEVEGYKTKEAENGKTWVLIKFDNQYGWVAESVLKSAD